MLRRDQRIGDSHMQVPGLDGEFGFGGTCFPKDTNALLYYAKLTAERNPLTILDSAVKSNNKRRLK